MILTGHNFLQDSKVIFLEKAPGMSFQFRLVSAFFPVTKSWPSGDSIIPIITFSSAHSMFSTFLG